MWALSSPDNAWRGYFLPLDEALAYRQQLRQRDRRAQVGCLLAVAFFGGLALWMLISRFLAGLPPASP